MASPNAFRFLGYRVPEVNIEIKDSLYAGHSGKLELAIDVQQNLVPENIRFVEIVLRLKATNDNESLKLGLTIKGGFEADKDMSDEVFKDLSEFNAPAVLLPYARAIITTVTAQAGIFPVILPLINLRAHPEVQRPDPAKS
jgi:preprotein translocase subunit SecB